MGQPGTMLEKKPDIQKCYVHSFIQYILVPDMGQAFTKVLEAQLKAFIKELKHKHKHLCF